MSKSASLFTCPAIIVCLFLVPLAASAKTVYVDDDAAGANNGSSWADAYYYLQDALMFAAAGDEIRVAQGVYRPDDFVLSRRPNLGRDETFQLINGVTLRGGYAGLGQPDPNARDFNEYETILSGDLNGDDVWDWWWNHPSRYENSYHVVTGNGTDETCTFDGFTVAWGYANGSYGNARGSGMYSANGSPTVANCTFERNLAYESGGGMYVSQSNPTIADCNFYRNVAVNGAGVFNEESSPTITNCNFNENEARYGSWGFGGGVYNYQSNPIIERCIMANNYAEVGGGIACNENSSPTIKNCTISGNLTYQDGGGIYCGASSNPIITNSTIVGNETEEAYVGGIACFGGSAPIITYSDIQGGWPGEGNIDVDPCFADVASGDYHLKSQAGRWEPNEGRWVMDEVTSPCIDAGDPMSPIGLEPFPNGGIVNMGAYGGTVEASKSYFGEPPCETIVAGDVNGDCVIDFRDFCIMALHWMEER